MRASTAALQRGALALAGAGALLLLVGLTVGHPALAKPGGAVTAVALAVGLGAVPPLRGYRFTAWIVAAVVCAMVYPERFLHLGGLDLRRPWLILAVVQLVMFGMGTQMSLRGLAGVLKMPYGVLVGLACQFGIMPLLGYGLARSFGFDSEIAAGVVLIGSCSSGLASNVMAYLAGANLALSITLTACATLLAPLVTPLWMKLLAGEFIEVGFFGMMVSIVRIVIVPVGAALLHDGLKTASPRRAPGRPRPGPSRTRLARRARPRGVGVAACRDAPGRERSRGPRQLRPRGTDRGRGVSPPGAPRPRGRSAPCRSSPCSASSTSPP